jgi:hypothetical protein
MHHFSMSRRGFMKSSGLLSAGLLLGMGSGHTESLSPLQRKFHVSLSIQALEKYPELLPTVADAGPDAIWVAAFLHGDWQYPPETVATWKKRIEAYGLEMNHITVPLGHPSFTETAPDYMDGTGYHPWQRGILPDGKSCYGVCIHPPVCSVNGEGVNVLYESAPGTIFLDDDFRLAPSPHNIGGCFCPEHKKAFLDKYGYHDGDWEALQHDVNERKLTPLLRRWLEEQCDTLTACFREQEAGIPAGRLGIMVMYMGSEKAGIRLEDYKDVPFRVGELMFNDKEFSRIKGKTDELFSVLFHRRFIRPELSYSESTAWPPDGLSASNLAAKLAISTLGDVRNTMLMSGLEPYPLSYWDILAPAMKAQRKLHETLAGHIPTGPFKHYWGEAGRWAGRSDPYSLFLATGVPFEVSDQPSNSGFTFFAEADAEALQNDERLSCGGTFITRSLPTGHSENFREVPEDLEALFALKHDLLKEKQDFPYVVEDLPVVCAWYPSAGSVALWNLQEKEQRFTLRFQDKNREVQTKALELVVVDLQA